MSAATSSVKHARAPETCQDAGQGALLTALQFGCPLVELQLGEQGAVLLVLLRTHTRTRYCRACRAVATVMRYLVFTDEVLRKAANVSRCW